jgi:uridine kinase
MTIDQQSKLVDSIDADKLAPWFTASKSYRSLRTSIRRALGFPQERRPLLIAIDGLDGAGKSSLAAWLSWQLEMPAVHLDLYIVRDSNPLEFRSNDLAKVLDARTNLNRPVIVEGILILKALSEIGRTPDFLVFVHRISHKSSLRTLTAEYIREFNPRQKANQTIKWSSAKRDSAIMRAHQNRPLFPESQ